MSKKARKKKLTPMPRVPALVKGAILAAAVTSAGCAEDVNPKKSDASVVDMALTAPMIAPMVEPPMIPPMAPPPPMVLEVDMGPTPDVGVTAPMQPPPMAEPPMAEPPDAGENNEEEPHLPASDDE